MVDDEKMADRLVALGIGIEGMETWGEYLETMSKADADSAKAGFFRTLFFQLNQLSKVNVKAEMGLKLIEALVDRLEKRNQDVPVQVFDNYFAAAINGMLANPQYHGASTSGIVDAAADVANEAIKKRLEVVDG